MTTNETKLQCDLCAILEETYNVDPAWLPRFVDRIVSKHNELYGVAVDSSVNTTTKRTPSIMSSMQSDDDPKRLIIMRDKTEVEKKRQDRQAGKHKIFSHRQRALLSIVNMHASRDAHIIVLGEDQKEVMDRLIGIGASEMSANLQIHEKFDRFLVPDISFGVPATKYTPTEKNVVGKEANVFVFIYVLFKENVDDDFSWCSGPFQIPTRYFVHGIEAFDLTKTADKYKVKVAPDGVKCKISAYSEG